MSRTELDARRTASETATDKWGIAANIRAGGREKEGRTPSPMQDWQQQYGASSFQEYFGQWTEQYPFLEEFMKKPPRERGFYPGQYTPPTRWV